MDLPVCYTPLWVSPSDKPVDDRLVNSCQVLRYQYIYYMPLWAHVQVLAAYILMQPDDIGLVPVTELFHELLCQKGHLFFGKNVFRGRIQGDMDNRFPYMRVECNVRFKACIQFSIGTLPEVSAAIFGCHKTFAVPSSTFILL